MVFWAPTTSTEPCFAALQSCRKFAVFFLPVVLRLSGLRGHHRCPYLPQPNCSTFCRPGFPSVHSSSLVYSHWNSSSLSSRPNRHLPRAVDVALKVVEIARVWIVSYFVRSYSLSQPTRWRTSTAFSLNYDQPRGLCCITLYRPGFSDLPFSKDFFTLFECRGWLERVIL